MTELEHALRDLATHVDISTDHDLASAVSERIASTAPGRVSARWRRPALVVAVIALVAGAAAAPAVADWLHLGVGGVEVRNEPAPEPLTTELMLGRRVAPGEAEVRVRFEVLVPDALGAPDEVWLDDGEIAIVSLVYRPSARLPRTDAGVGVLIQQFDAPPVLGGGMTKFAGPENHIERVTVGDAPGIWLEGAHGIGLHDAHGIRYVPNRLAANALVWEQGGTTYRIESRLGRDASLAIAKTLR